MKLLQSLLCLLAYYSGAIGLAAVQDVESATRELTGIVDRHKPKDRNHLSNKVEPHSVMRIGFLTSIHSVDIFIRASRWTHEHEAD